MCGGECLVGSLFPHNYCWLIIEKQMKYTIRNDADKKKKKKFKTKEYKQN